MTDEEHSNDRAELFALLRTTPDFLLAAAAGPPRFAPGLVYAPVAIGSALVAAFGGIVLYQTTIARRHAGGGLSWDYAPDHSALTVLVVGIAVGVLVAAVGFVPLMRYRRSPRVAVAAVVVAKRHEGELFRGAGPRFFMEFDFDSLGHSEEAIDVETFGDARPGDVGVAWLQGGQFLGFRRVRA